MGALSISSDAQITVGMVCRIGRDAYLSAGRSQKKKIKLW